MKGFPVHLNLLARPTSLSQLVGRANFSLVPASKPGKFESGPDTVNKTPWQSASCQRKNGFVRGWRELQYYGVAEQWPGELQHPGPVMSESLSQSPRIPACQNL
jgi:hypothetical protein